MEDERTRQVFLNEVANLRRQNASLQSQIEKLARDQKNLLKVHERGGCILPRKRPRGDGTGGDDLNKRRMYTHPAMQLDRVRISFAA